MQRVIKTDFSLVCFIHMLEWLFMASRLQILLQIKIKVKFGIKYDKLILKIATKQLLFASV